MVPEYYPEREVDNLKSVLRHDKKPIGLFLGAGCPYSIRIKENGIEKPLIQDIEGISKSITSRLSKTDLKDDIDILCKQLIEDGNSAPNIEHMLNQIRTLRQICGKSEVRGLCSGKLEKLENEICREVVHEVDKNLPEFKTPYHSIATWISAIPRQYPVEIFTPNYDLLMEQAFENNRVPYFDGFVGRCKPFFDPYSIEEVVPARWARIWKLHGSINWRLNKDKNRAFIQSGDNSESNPLIIHPTHLKYDQSRQMPYLAMLDRLKSFLKVPSAALIICGYSFNDQHLNSVIIQGLMSNPTSIAFALLYGDMKSYTEILKHAVNRPNLNLLAEDSALIGTQQHEWSIRDASSTMQDANSPAISWSEIGEDKVKAKFNLGDFTQLGDFIINLVGAREKEDENENE